MSPLANRDDQRVYNRTRQKETRLWWLSQHPCPCGQPSVRIRGKSGAIPRVWSFGKTAIAEDLEGVEIEYFCGDCWYRLVVSTTHQRDIDGRKDKRKGNRQLWLSAHECACGATPVSMRGRSTILPQGIWACSQTTIDEKLGAIVIDYFCEGCRAQLPILRDQRRYANTKIRRERERRVLPPKFRPEQEPKIQAPRVRTPRPKTAKPEPRVVAKRNDLIPLFAEKHRCPDCGDEFPRYALLSRHQRSGCAA